METSNQFRENKHQLDSKLPAGQYHWDSGPHPPDGGKLFFNVSIISECICI